MEDRSHIATTLRTARERLDLTIERAAAGAGVPLRYARLLEGEAPQGIGVSDELYLIPFFRRYATALGLPAEELLPDFLGQVQEVPAPSVAPVRKRTPSRARAAWKPLAIVLTIAAATFVIVRQTPRRPAVEDEPWNESERPSAAAPTAAPAATPAFVAAATSSPAAEVALASPAGAAESPAAALGRELRIAAAEETWISLGIDDEPRRSILLQPGEMRSWTASRGFILTVGNAGGIAVTFDGRELPPLGRPGQVVRDLHLPPNESTPE